MYDLLATGFNFALGVGVAILVILALVAEWLDPRESKWERAARLQGEAESRRRARRSAFEKTFETP